MPKKPRVELPEEVREWFRQTGSVGGTIAANMCKKARRERAKKAVAAREAKRRKDNQEQKETKLAMSPAEPSTKVKKQPHLTRQAVMSNFAPFALPSFTSSSVCATP